MISEESKSEKGEIIIRRETGLTQHPTGNSSALTEIINRSLVHIQTSKTLEEVQRTRVNELAVARFAGEEQEFEIAPGVNIVMCWIPPGEFLMGSHEDEFEREDNETQHQVTLTCGFWLGKYQITQAQWVALMGSNPSNFKGATLPVECVSWDDITESGGFLEKVNRSFLDGWIYSLPTEAQWEYACRAGTTTTLNNGKNLTTHEGVCRNLDEVAWYQENSNDTTHPVGQKKANSWGLHDMHGNVYEWCVDWDGDYPDEPVVDPRGPETESYYRVYRGGSWSDEAYFCRAAVRDGLIPGGSLENSGFRLARCSIA